MNSMSYRARADRASEGLNREDEAKVLALLALAAAIDNLADEVRGTGTEAQPLHFKEA